MMPADDAIALAASPTLPLGCGPLLPGPVQDPKPLRQKVFEHVRATGTAARADVSRALGISAGSVTQLTSDLIERGFLRETDDNPRDRRDAGRGRPAVALTVVPESRRVIGIKLSDERHTAVLADFAGTILAEAMLPTPAVRKTLDQIAEETAALVERVLEQAALPRDAISAVGIGISGLVEPIEGTIPWSPLIAGKDLPLRAALNRRLGLPVLIDNDANMLTLAELWFGAGRAMSDFAVVTIEHGVGMGLVVGNRLYRGTRGMGMELGHTKVHLDGALCRCGQRGCLEAYLADYALAREAATALGRNPRAMASAQAMLETLFAEAKGGNMAARSIFRRAGRYLAVGLSNVIQLFDPELIILSGERMRYDYLYADEVMAETLELTLNHGRSPCRVETHNWGDMVWARGAAALALGYVTDTALGQGAA
ncbi:ROK family protein [Pararhodobacter aggregans]|uniref:ROK family protein n=1 Tax=Pararhodobacter aggregans TaxID=404875 RepID=UPI003A936498